MLEVTLPGTGGTMPLKNRWLTCCLLRQEGETVLIDCGEGTQIALRCAGKTVQRLRLLCFTHYHADHISGLPGLLLSMGLDGRTEPLMLAGPKGLRRVVEGLRVIAPELPFSLEFTELAGGEQLRAAGLLIEPFAAQHTLPCLGYRMTLPRAGKFDPEKAKANNVPMRAWGLLQKQETVGYEGVTYHRDQVLGPSRRGIVVTYCTDTRPVAAIAQYGVDSDLMILEGMYGEPDKRKKALETKHMMFTEAAELAKEAGARTLWLTHYSPSLPDPCSWLDAPRAIFPQTFCAADGQSVDLCFQEESREIE